METKSLSINSVYIPEIETLLGNLKTDYQEFNKIEPKILAEKPGLVTPTQVEVCMNSPIHTKGQQVINEVAKRAQIRAQFFNAKDSEQQAADEHAKLGMQKQEKQRQTQALQQEKERTNCDATKLKHWQWVCIGALIAGCADAATAYGPIRNVYAVLPAVLICLVIALAVGMAHHAYVPWIKSAKTRLEKWLKISAVCSLAGTFFFYIATLRASAAVAQVSVDPTYHQTATTISALAIAVVSYVLFEVVFALAMRFYVSKEERQKIEDGKKAAATLQAHEEEIKAIEAKQEKLKADTLKRRADIRQLNDYYRYIIASVKTLAEGARKDFKHIYGQYKHDLPEFFLRDEPFVFDEHTNLFSKL